MNHIDEHTLELFVLGAAEIEPRSREIEQHLAECVGCRGLADEMMRYHHDVAKRLRTEPVKEVSSQRAVARKRWEPIPFEEPMGAEIIHKGNSMIGKTWQLMKRYPMRATAASCLFGAGLFGMIFLKGVYDREAENPYAGHFLVAEERFEVLNKDNKKLWDIPIVGAATLAEMPNQYAIADLDDDGQTEVLLAGSLLGEKVDPIKGGRVRVLDGNKNLVWEQECTEQVQYPLHTAYNPYFDVDQVIAGDFVKTGENEVIISAANRGRSPNMIARLDDRGNFVGKYFHFGNLVRLLPIDQPGTGKKSIIACGMNDTDDLTRNEFPAFVVLDPSKITGTSNSTVTPGFGFPPSNAEIFYVRFPVLDIAKAIGTSAGITSVMIEDPHTIRFQVTGRNDVDHFAFDFFLSMDMKAMYVKSGNETDRLFDKLVANGVLHGKMDQNYLDNLRDGIRYWDGKGWEKGVTMVKQ